ncbi:MAG: PIN domain-containing protein [Verrucomicrobiales bacterium]|jgi:predicted nucleic acid-binding protein|nr:PIN domain-containing protein [Verrucomicrobiales bacterium]
MTYLLDVNVLLALLINRHQHHQRVKQWMSKLDKNDIMLLCPPCETGFIRLSHQLYDTDLPISKQLAIDFAARSNVRRVPDNQFANALPAWVKNHKQVSDGHLQAVAAVHHAQLATLDEGIPRAFLLPK